VGPINERASRRDSRVNHRRVANVPRPRLRSIFLLVKDLTENAGLDVMASHDGYELLQYSTLGQIRRLLDAHWPLFNSRFIIRNQQMAFTVFVSTLIELSPLETLYTTIGPLVE
jgi:hypothetical protein